MVVVVVAPPKLNLGNAVGAAAAVTALVAAAPAAVDATEGVVMLLAPN